MKRILPLVLLLAIFTGCNSRYFRQAMKVAGEEAAYAALTTALVAAGVTSADHFTDAVRYAVQKQDYGGAMASFSMALAEHNVPGARQLTARQVTAIMRLAVPAVSRQSGKVGSVLAGFCDYVDSHS
jgi:hypothetical protein